MVSGEPVGLTGTQRDYCENTLEQKRGDQERDEEGRERVSMV